ncbi:hypothetical protein GE061_016215 [Apolygus lucorum]|uniref:Uncharacterized protein n=1 Tax=Apolygus lucorum TaxID=248454 RepID=A0A8S9XFK8_APOLU|nr:hypothetical protein GE061_016215 [Apolygus lucorum]
MAQEPLDEWIVDGGPQSPDPVVELMRKRTERFIADLRNQPPGHVATPAPSDDPYDALETLTNFVRFTMCGDTPTSRHTSGNSALLTILQIHRWIPLYQRIVQERDALLDRQAKWLLDRQQLVRQRDAAVEESKAANAQVCVEPPAAKTATPEATHQSSAEAPAARSAEAERELARSPAPPPASSPAPSQSPQSVKTRDPQLEPYVALTPIRSPPTTPLPPRRARGRVSSYAESPTPDAPPTPGRSPMTSSESETEKAEVIPPPAHPRIVLRISRKKKCPVCTKTVPRLFVFRCPGCKEFWQRLKSFHSQGRPLPECPEDHRAQRDPANCRGCRRHAYELAIRKARPLAPLGIPSVVFDNAGSRREGGCESPLTGEPFQ